MKRVYDCGHRIVTFVVGDWEWLHIRHGALACIVEAGSSKLRRRYYGPYKIVGAINPIAFHLALPPGACLHDIFHVNLLKKFAGTPKAAPPDFASSLLQHRGAYVRVCAPCLPVPWGAPSADLVGK